MSKGQVNESGVEKVRGIWYELKLEREVGSIFFFYVGAIERHLSRKIT